MKGEGELPNGSSQGGCFGVKLTILAGILFAISFLLPASLLAQSYSTTIHKTVLFQNAQNSKNELRVYNINGSVKVEGYGGNKIKVTATKYIDGNEQQVREGKRDLHLKIKRFGNKIAVYIDAPFAELCHHHGHINYEINRHTGNWNGEDNYRFSFDIRIKMPRNTAVHASTINKGTVFVKNTTGRVFASNINGDIRLAHISGQTHASTINGDITAKYDHFPTKDSGFHTINGDITVYYPSDLSANIQFQSLHGDLYTNFNNIERQMLKVDTRNREEKTYFRIGGHTSIRIGSGGPTYQFKVLNGDVFIKKNRS